MHGFGIDSGTALKSIDQCLHSSLFTRECLERCFGDEFINVWASLTFEKFFNWFLKSFSNVNYFRYFNDNYKKCYKHEKWMKTFSKLYIKKLKNVIILKKFRLYFHSFLKKSYLNVTKTLFKFRIFYFYNVIIILMMLLLSHASMHTYRICWFNCRHFYSIKLTFEISKINVMIMIFQIQIVFYF